MLSKITDSSDTLMNQASMTADTYLSEAIERIDARLGDGYAAEHPELLAAFMTTAAADFHTAITAQHLSSALVEAAETISRGVWDGATHIANEAT